MSSLTESTEGMTVIGDSMSVRGNLSGDEDLQVLGRVEGSVELSCGLHVAESGVVRAEVHVQTAVISGVVVGNITATESVEVTDTGQMLGDIASPRVILVDGARFRGSIDMGEIDENAGRVGTSRASSSTESKKPEPVVEPVKVATPAPRVEPKKAPAKTPARASSTKKGGKKPSFLEPPKARGLPKKKSRSRVVVKRK